jgi:hypothetical protein
MVPRVDIISHFQYPWRVIPQVRVTCTEKGCYVEVGVTASHIFTDGLISHLRKILSPIVCLVDRFYIS